MEQTRALSSCFNHVIIPWSNDRVSGGDTYNATHGPNGSVFEETAYGLAGISGESRSGDANGQYIRVIGGGGSNTVQSHDMSTGEDLAGVTPLPIDGSMPPFAREDAVPARCAVREPGPTEPRGDRRPGTAAARLGARRRRPGARQRRRAARRRRDARR